MFSKTDKRSTIYYGTLLICSLAVFTVFIFIAWRSFFFQDDFGFLLPVVFGDLRVIPDLADLHFFRPVSRELFFLVSYHFFGKESFGFYLVNIAAHLLSAICLFFILVKLKLSNKLSILVVFLFFSNVAAFEKISWISNFQHTSYQIFLLLSALFAIHSTEKYGVGRISLISLSVISWVLSIFSHMAGLFFPFILILLLYVKLSQDNDEKFKGILSVITKTTFAHWMVFFIYVAFIMLPHWKSTDISDPYYIEPTIMTFYHNLLYYFKSALFTNFHGNYLVLVAIFCGYAIFFVPRTITNFPRKKFALINFLILMVIFCLLYAPFAFLKYQRYANYVSLALIPWYVIILYPILSYFKMQNISYLKKLLVTLFIVILTISFLPGEKDFMWYVKYSPKLHIKSIWDQTQLMLPEIPEGIRRVVFIDGEDKASTHSEEVPVWKIPPFWWHVGHGTMFAIIYGKLDIEFEVTGEKPVLKEPDSIYVTVDKGPIYYALSLYK